MTKSVTFRCPADLLAKIREQADADETTITDIIISDLEEIYEEPGEFADDRLETLEVTVEKLEKRLTRLEALANY